ncbi:MAG: helix-turn-helix domain-containing protein [Pigmentiphaga sp.]|uniref:helix-turn-helix domain-containing protein n=1 Tax=Pigmentiphaga sp. TaxID=1977564 RepID=UPI0029BE50B5|nr:helix-turn-helix domain-containing protein [Pigmentiphaga sp.]MDX3907217.1 helix-turn-helix domain-containing protein [Pigmentiphaga sp.]
MSATGIIGPVVRALNILRALNHQPQSSLQSLHLATGLPKSTVHRLLMTLKSEGYVRSDVVKGTYSLTDKVRCLSDGFSEPELVVEIGAPILLKNTRATGLPLAIGTLDRGHIVVRYSSMPYSPIGSEHTTVGHVHDLVRSGMGQAFLASCGDAERQRLMQWLQSSVPDPRDWARIEREIERSLMATRRRGYGLRKGEGRGSSTTLAVPLSHGERVLGVLSLTTFDALLVPERLRECLDLLARTQAEIEAAAAGRLQGA